MTYTIYKCHDETGAILYIGVTSRGEKRISEHARHKAWFQYVSLVTYEYCDSVREARDREIALITEHAPPYNGRAVPYGHAPLALTFPIEGTEPNENVGLTLVEMAEELGVKSTTALRRLCEAGVLRAEKKGKTWLIHTAEVERYKRERKRGRPPKRPAAPQEDA